MKERLKKLIPFGEIALLYFIFYVVGIGCPIRFCTGISCAGCGMTRAWLAMLRLDFKAAFHYHPLALFPVIFPVIFLMKNKINKKLYKAIMIAMITLMLGVYIFRMLDPHDHIVVFNIGNNIITKIYRLLRR